MYVHSNNYTFLVLTSDNFFYTFCNSAQHVLQEKLINSDEFSHVCALLQSGGGYKDDLERIELVFKIFFFLLLDNTSRELNICYNSLKLIIDYRYSEAGILSVFGFRRPFNTFYFSMD